MNTWAIIPSAGQGRRFGALKQFVKLGGKPLLSYALETFSGSPLIRGVCLVVPEQEINQTRETLLPSLEGKRIQIVSGGPTRQESVDRGFSSIEPCDLVVIHDGVRPFISTHLIEKVILAAREFGAAIPGQPIAETTKEVSEDLFVKKTIDRSLLWSIQTPQAFQYAVLKKALEEAQKEKLIGTDEAMLVEHIGLQVKVVEGEPYNIKITCPRDMEMAEQLLPAWRGNL